MFLEGINGQKSLKLTIFMFHIVRPWFRFRLQIRKVRNLSCNYHGWVSCELLEATFTYWNVYYPSPVSCNKALTTVSPSSWSKQSFFLTLKKLLEQKKQLCRFLDFWLDVRNKGRRNRTTHIIYIVQYLK